MWYEPSPDHLLRITSDILKRLCIGSAALLFVCSLLVMNLAATMRGEFDETFPDLSSLPKGADRVPGRRLGELVVEGLRQRGFTTSDVQYKEPFFVTRCRSGKRTYPIVAYLAYSDDMGPVWAVYCQRTIGFWDRLVGRYEEKELSRVLEAIHDVLLQNSRITDIRWFPEPPFDPFSEKKYGISPIDPEQPSGGR